MKGFHKFLTLTRLSLTNHALNTIQKESINQVSIKALYKQVRKIKI